MEKFGLSADLRSFTVPGEKARYLAWTKTIGCTIRKNGRVCSRHISQDPICSKGRLLKTPWGSRIHCSSDDAFGTPYRIGCFVGSFWSEVRVTTRANKSIVMDLVREYAQKQQDQKQPNNPNKSTQTIRGGEPDCCSQTRKVLLTAVVFPALTSLSGKSVASRYTWESMAVWLVHLFYLTNSFIVLDVIRE